MFIKEVSFKENFSPANHFNLVIQRHAILQLVNVKTNCLTFVSCGYFIGCSRSRLNMPGEHVNIFLDNKFDMLGVG